MSSLEQLRRELEAATWLDVLRAAVAFVRGLTWLIAFWLLYWSAVASSLALVFILKEHTDATPGEDVVLRTFFDTLGIVLFAFPVLIVLVLLGQAVVEWLEEDVDEDEEVDEADEVVA